ncbi:MAG TPA: LysR family transcriptional regulator [Steroidobacteraceae bacterium]|nr:LysR family transcriptional regulator [Steroidobacteraceae bacterium]
MESLDDFYYFAKIVEFKGFAAAGRALGIPKSRLSRHVSDLERRLNVRLVNRSTRHLAITHIGQEVYRRATAMVGEAEAAVAAVEFAQAEPRGVVRLSCPVSLAQNPLAALLPEFFLRHPAIRLLIHASNRRVDLLNEGFDLALRVRATPGGEDGLVMRTFGRIRERLVASRAYLEASGKPQRPEELARHATLGFAPEADSQVWELNGPQDESVRVEVAPRLVCHDFVVLRAAALAGTGIALLPETLVRSDLDAGRLEPVLPEWSLPQGVLHVVFHGRRGVLPAVRATLDFLAERLPGLGA